jgi:hypothetical protein
MGVGNGVGLSVIVACRAISCDYGYLPKICRSRPEGWRAASRRLLAGVRPPLEVPWTRDRV